MLLCRKHADILPAPTFTLWRIYESSRAQLQLKSLLLRKCSLTQHWARCFSRALCTFVGLCNPNLGFSRWCGKESAYQSRRFRRSRFDAWSKKFPGGGSDNPFQCSCLGNPTDTGAWRAPVHQVTKSQTWLSDSTFVVVQSLSCSVVSNSLPSHGLQHARLSCPSLSPGVGSNSCTRTIQTSSTCSTYHTGCPVEKVSLWAIILELENNLESRLFLLLSLIIFEDPDFPNSKHIEFHFLKFCFISVSIHFLLKYV